MRDGLVRRVTVVLALSLLTAGGMAAAVPGAKPDHVRIGSNAALAPQPSWNITKIGSLLSSAAHAGEAMAADGAADGYAVLPTTSAAELVTAREVWGKGGEQKPIEAPLAAGAISPLPADTMAAPQGFEGAPTVHPLQPTPPAQLTPVPQDQLADALKKLLAEREGWLKAPAKPAAAAPAPAAAAVTTATTEVRAAAGTTAAAGNGYAILPTTSATDLIAQRDTWRPSAGSASSDAAASVPAMVSSSSNGYALLPTSGTADLFAAREAWGKGPEPKAVPAPLATGSYSPLPSVKVEVPKGFEGEPAVHALQATPAPQLTPVPPSQIDEALKKLFAERQSWGMATVQSTAAAGGYAILPTTGAAELIAAREAWGKGAPAEKVAAPLAAGAMSPLPATTTAPPTGFSGEPAVHALQAMPAPQPTPVPPSQIDDAMKKLLAEREGWGNAPSKTGAKAAAAAPVATSSRSTEAVDCEAKLRQAISAGVILFQSASASLSATSNMTLDELVSVAKGCKTGRIRVEGHTDSTGRALFNMSLSEQRAKAVANYFTRAGVAADRIEAVGYGQDKPIASNTTAEGRAKNRRIEFTVVE